MLGLIYQAPKRSSGGSSSRLRSCGASFMAPVRNARRGCWSRWSFSSKELEATTTEDELAAEQVVARSQAVQSFQRKRPSRKPFPDHLRASAS